MKTKKWLVAVLMTTLLLTVNARADSGAPAEKAASIESDKPIQLALFPPDAQLIHEENSITGLRLDLIYGRNANVSGVDIGLVHEATGSFQGVEFGVMNLVRGDAVGLQLGGIYSETKGHISGGQVGIVNRAGSINGVQIGLANFADDMTGVQFGLFNQIRSKQSLPVLPILNAKF